jgi:hypothetical protein
MNNNRGKVFSERSAPRCCKQDKSTELWDSRRPVKTWTRKLRELQHWKALSGNNRWRYSWLKRLSTCCSELQSVWISDSAVAACSNGLQVFNKSNYQFKPRPLSLNHVTICLVQLESSLEGVWGPWTNLSMRARLVRRVNSNGACCMQIFVWAKLQGCEYIIFYIVD